MDRTHAKFSDTRWSLVLVAKEADNTAAHGALEELCQSYWEPIYAYIRFQGKRPHDAEELTQEFFVRVLDKEMFQNVDASKGRLRSFLLKSLKNFLINESEKGKAQKRGGGIVPIPLDFVKAEQNFEIFRDQADSPERIYDKHWAHNLVGLVSTKLQSEYERTGKAQLFGQLKPSLEGASLEATHAEIATRCGMTIDAVKKAAQRLRKKFRETLLEEVAETISDRSEAEDELRALLMCFG